VFHSFGQSDKVDRFAIGKQLSDGCKNFLVGGFVKIIRSNDFKDVEKNIVVQKGRTDYGFFRLDALRRKFLKRGVSAGSGNLFFSWCPVCCSIIEGNIRATVHPVFVPGIFPRGCAQYAAYLQHKMERRSRNPSSIQINMTSVILNHQL
jgi:hypothetical protein